MYFHLNPVRIAVDKLKLRCNIGFSEWEQNKIQEVEISYSFAYFRPLLTNQDSELDCINYKLINKRIIELIDNSSYQLLESLAEVVYSEISNHKGVFDASVTASKPHALRFTDNVSVKIRDWDRHSMAILSIGSNIEPNASITKALELLQGKVNILFCADPIKTKAIGSNDQPDFLNSVAVIKTDLSPSDLRLTLREIEGLCGRVREECKNAPRTIDLDLIRYGNQTYQNKDLEYPFFQDLLSKYIPGFIVP